MSSIAEPNPSLFSGKMQDLTGLDPSEQLRTDVRVMGSLLGKIINLKCGPEIFDKVEVMRSMAKVSDSMTGTFNTTGFFLCLNQAW
jgi:hypothetical protein